MGHIVVSGELKTLEKKTDTTIISTSSAPSTPLQQQSPTSSQLAKARRFQSCVGNSWHECVQGVSVLLPSPYAERWLRCLEQLLHNEGPLPESWRIYIAILALCRHEVTWAVRALTLEFISADGDRKWLSGLRFAPKKLRALSPINNLLAHRPWLLTSQHILDLTKGEESWSFSELCQALCLITHFHSFASFLHACLPLPPTSSSLPNSLPLTPRTSPAKSHLPSSLPDTLNSKSPLELPPIASVPSSKSNNATKESTNGNVLSASPSKSVSALVRDAKGTPLSPSKTPSENGTTSTSTTSVPISIPPLPKGLEEQQNGAKSLVPPGSAKREIQASPQPSKQSKNESHTSRSIPCKEEMPSSLREFPHLCHDLTFMYEDFPCKSPSSFFKIWEFNWPDHGYSLMTRLLNEMGNLIEERFVAVKMLSHVAWDRNKDNGLHYRTAVWNYIQSFYGIHHDDYLYSQIDNYLTQEIKRFIKKCCCWPETLEGKIPSDLLSTCDKLPSQLVPLSILIMEARLESELLYALNAIIPHQS